MALTTCSELYIQASQTVRLLNKLTTLLAIRLKITPYSLVDLEALIREKERLQKSIASLTKDHETKIKRIESQNKELKTRVSVEQEERNKLVELLQAKEREISIAREANGGNSNCVAYLLVGVASSRDF